MIIANCLLGSMRCHARSNAFWCNTNNLFLNVNKTKEMVIDFRRNKSQITPLYINNTEVEQISTGKPRYNAQVRTHQVLAV